MVLRLFVVWVVISGGTPFFWGCENSLESQSTQTQPLIAPSTESSSNSPFSTQTSNGFSTQTGNSLIRSVDLYINEDPLEDETQVYTIYNDDGVSCRSELSGDVELEEGYQLRNFIHIDTPFKLFIIELEEDEFFRWGDFNIRLASVDVRCHSRLTNAESELLDSVFGDWFELYSPFFMPENSGKGGGAEPFESESFNPSPL